MVRKTLKSKAAMHWWPGLRKHWASSADTSTHSLHWCADDGQMARACVWCSALCCEKWVSIKNSGLEQAWNTWTCSHGLKLPHRSPITYMLKTKAYTQRRPKIKIKYIHNWSSMEQLVSMCLKLRACLMILLVESPWLAQGQRTVWHQDSTGLKTWGPAAVPYTLAALSLQHEATEAAILLLYWVNTVPRFGFFLW